MEHGIPVGNSHVEAVDFAQNFCRKDKQQNDDFQRAGQHNFEPAGNNAGQNHQKQRQAAQRHALIFSPQQGTHHDKNNQRTQHHIYRQGGLVFVDWVFLFVLGLTSHKRFLLFFLPL